MQRYRDRFRKSSGVVLIGVAQERASAWSATKQRQSRFVEFVYLRKSVYVNHYYIYLIDPEWGPAFIKICGLCPLRDQNLSERARMGQTTAPPRPSPVYGLRKYAPSKPSASAATANSTDCKRASDAVRTLDCGAGVQ